MLKTRQMTISRVATFHSVASQTVRLDFLIFVPRELCYDVSVLHLAEISLKGLGLPGVSKSKVKHGLDLI
jgi:hypothetical protein